MGSTALAVDAFGSRTTSTLPSAPNHYTIVAT